MISNTKRGYTLLMAVMVSSVILSIAAFILSIGRKQIILTSTSRDSTTAFYAADSGIQCALMIYQQYSTTSPVNVYCNGSKVVHNFESVEATAFRENTAFQIESTLVYGKACTNFKMIDGIDDATGGHVTVLESRGYNSYDSDTNECPKKAGLRVLERAIRLVYYD